MPGMLVVQCLEMAAEGTSLEGTDGSSEPDANSDGSLVESNRSFLSGEHANR